MTHRDSSAVFALLLSLLLSSSSHHYIESMGFTFYLNFLAVKVASLLDLFLWIFSWCIYTKESKVILTMWDTLGKITKKLRWLQQWYLSLVVCTIFEQHWCGKNVCHSLEHHLEFFFNEIYLKVLSSSLHDSNYQSKSLPLDYLCTLWID